MSYDLRIYTTQIQNLKESLKQFNVEIYDDICVVSLKRHQIVISHESQIEDEDIEVPEDLYQPKAGRYPKTWLFDGPFKEN